MSLASFLTPGNFWCLPTQTFFTLSSMATKLLRLVADKKKVDGGDGGNAVQSCSKFTLSNFQPCV